MHWLTRLGVWQAGALGEVPPMQRFTIPLDDKLAQAFDEWIGSWRQAKRSEAVRDLLRAELERVSQGAAAGADCLDSLSFVYDRHELDVASRLSTLHHDNHDVLIASMHGPLDYDFRMETLALRGKMSAVHLFADLLCAQRGVRHGKLNLISVEMHQSHRHPRAAGTAAAKQPHVHMRLAH